MFLFLASFVISFLYLSPWFVAGAVAAKVEAGWQRVRWPRARILRAILRSGLRRWTRPPSPWKAMVALGKWTRPLPRRPRHAHDDSHRRGKLLQLWPAAAAKRAVATAVNISATTAATKGTDVATSTTTAAAASWQRVRGLHSLKGYQELGCYIR